MTRDTAHTPTVTNNQQHANKLSIRRESYTMSPVARTWALHCVSMKLMDLGSDAVWEIQHGDYDRGVRLCLAMAQLSKWYAINS
jgi:hypothetical protein